MEIEDEGEVEEVLLEEEHAVFFTFFLSEGYNKHVLSFLCLHLSVSPCLASPKRKKEKMQGNGDRRSK